MFYLNAPKIIISLTTLEEDSMTRMDLFEEMMRKGMSESNLKTYFDKSSSKKAFNFDSLMEGSQRDCASHFLFRLANLNSDQTQHFWIKCEKSLLRYRLQCSTSEMIEKFCVQLVSELTIVLNGLKILPHQKSYYETLLKIIEHLIEHKSFFYCHSEEDICSHFFKVPWHFVLDLIRDREITLKKGIALIPCKMLFSFLTAMLEDTILMEIEQLKSVNLDLEDYRIQHIVNTIHRHLREIVNKQCTISYSTCLKRQLFSVSDHKTVNKIQRFIPLCMQQLHSKLIKHNRLRHHERIRYSLFLKDIGLPINENLIFWKNYYTQHSSTSHSVCQHTWDSSSSKRFEYSLRHMYGMEGKRVSYRAHSCSALQMAKSQPQDLCGCPFADAQRDDTYLKSILNYRSSLWNEQYKAVMREAHNSRPSDACGLYLAHILHKHNDCSNRLSRFPSLNNPHLSKSKVAETYFRKTKSALHFSSSKKSGKVSTLKRNLPLVMLNRRKDETETKHFKGIIDIEDASCCIKTSTSGEPSASNNRNPMLEEALLLQEGKECLFVPKKDNLVVPVE